MAKCRNYCKLGAKEVTAIIHKKEINPADNNDARLKKVTEYAELFANPYSATESEFTDGVILPIATHRKRLKTFAVLKEVNYS